MVVEPVAQRRVARVAVRMIRLVEHRRLDTRGRGPLQPAGVRPAGADADHLDPRVQQRLQVGALTRHQHAHAHYAAACSTGYGPEVVEIWPASMSSSTRARMSARRMCDEVP